MKPEKEMILWKSMELSTIDYIKTLTSDIETHLQQIETFQKDLRRAEIRRMLEFKALEFIQDTLKGLKVNTLEEPVECPPKE